MSKTSDCDIITSYYNINSRKNDLMIAGLDAKATCMKLIITHRYKEEESYSREVKFLS